ncbi:MAG: biotin--[acetyl-CoA-carboxylase] ligase [Thermoflexales bacterium]|nr:biotin--[acetyl-CoA-carboxylase] ligase [Thermoflexales bacterium]
MDRIPFTRIHLASTTSTNDVARDMAARGAPEGTVVTADYQTAGRGRRGRRWLAPPGTSLLCSVLFRPTSDAGAPSHATDLTMLCALAAAGAVEAIARLPVSLKWPNDLVVVRGDSWRKLGGLLAETGVSGGRLEFVIVGVGINVNIPTDALPDLAPDATSILAETGQMTDREALLDRFLNEVKSCYERWQAGERPWAEWAARLATLGRRVRVVTAEGEKHGIAEGVDEEGTLLLRTSDGRLHRIRAGDVLLAH